MGNMKKIEEHNLNKYIRNAKLMIEISKEDV
jgi:hypothetical protein